MRFRIIRRVPIEAILADIEKKKPLRSPARTRSCPHIGAKGQSRSHAASSFGVDFRQPVQYISGFQLRQCRHRRSRSAIGEITNSPPAYSERVGAVFPVACPKPLQDFIADPVVLGKIDQLAAHSRKNIRGHCNIDDLLRIKRIASGFRHFFCRSCRGFMPWVSTCLKNTGRWLLVPQLSSRLDWNHRDAGRCLRDRGPRRAFWSIVHRVRPFGRFPAQRRGCSRLSTRRRECRCHFIIVSAWSLPRNPDDAAV